MLLCDSNEPKEAVSLIGQVVACTVAALNANGWADYRWEGLDGKVTNVERKTWPEILANVDAVEEQLRKHMERHPDARTLFVLEGWAVDSLTGSSLVVPVGGKDSLWARGHGSSTRLSRIWSWLYAASEYVEVFQTGNYAQTCAFLVAAYKQDMKEPEQKRIFHRHFKEVVFHPNPQVLKLMAIEPGFGEKRAEALIEKFTTVWRVLNSSVAELSTVPGIGPVLASRLLQRVGRPDV